MCQFFIAQITVNTSRDEIERYSVRDFQDGLDLGWRMVDMLGSSLWAVDSRDCLMVRENATPENIDGKVML